MRDSHHPHPAPQDERRPVPWTRLLLFVVAPLAELTSIIAVGTALGAGRAFLLLLAGVLVGSLVISSQGRKAMASAVHQMQDATGRPVQAPGVDASTKRPRPVQGRGWLFLAGALFIAPGFVSDAVALLLFIPFVRTALSAAAAALGVKWMRGLEQQFVPPGSPLRGDVVPGQVIDEDPTGPSRPAGHGPEIIEGRVIDD